MKTIKAWVVTQRYGTKKSYTQDLVYVSKDFKKIVRYLETKEEILDNSNWRVKRTKIGLVANQNKQWIGYGFYEIKVMV